MAPKPAAIPHKAIQLPRTSTRAQKPLAHLKLLTAVRAGAFSAAFEGQVYPPGAVIDADLLPVPAVILECVGQVGLGTGHRRREVLWVLWNYDWSIGEWVQLASAQSVNWEWTVALREPAIRALHPQPEFVDVLDRGRTVAGEIMSMIDRRAEAEIAGVRLNVLNSVYDQVAGRLAALG